MKNCDDTGNEHEHEPCQSKPHQNLMEHKMCLATCIVTKPHLGKVCIFYQYC